MTHKYRWPFLTLLLSLILLFVVYPLVSDIQGGAWIFDAFTSLVFIAAFSVIFRQTRLRLPALMLGIPTLIGSWTGHFLPRLAQPAALVTYHLIATMFMTLTTIAILWLLYQQERLTVDSGFGAFCGYLLVGLAFGHLYCVLEIANPGSFAGQDHLTKELQNGYLRHFVLSYFSIVTLTTVGFGDIVPIHGAARGLAMVEAVVGQFYIAVLVAELIGKRVAQAFDDR